MLGVFSYFFIDEALIHLRTYISFGPRINIGFIHYFSLLYQVLDKKKKAL